MVSILSLMTVLTEPQALYSKLVTVITLVSKHQKKLKLKGLQWRKKPDKQQQKKLVDLKKFKNKRGLKWKKQPDKHKKKLPDLKLKG